MRKEFRAATLGSLLLFLDALQTQSVAISSLKHSHSLLWKRTRHIDFVLHRLYCSRLYICSSRLRSFLDSQQRKQIPPQSTHNQTTFPTVKNPHDIISYGESTSKAARLRRPAALKSIYFAHRPGTLKSPYFHINT